MELEAAVEEVETLQSQLKVLVHEYREKLEAAKKKHETPVDTILKEVITFAVSGWFDHCLLAARQSSTGAVNT